MTNVAGPAHEVHDELSLVSKIRESDSPEHAVTTTLRTDQRVIARVTDGIYRQPGSAIRELISNAYDADARRIVVLTDAPRFSRISFEDDGLGMSPETLAHLLLHIGGSAKRTQAGQDLGVTSKSDPMRSPSGRPLIGKIGIGLFSVSQLTHSFQIITKVKGDSFRTVATVVLRQYADEDFQTNEDGEQKFESGKVSIWREKAVDIESHGTTIVLTNIRPQARDTLRSRDIWAAVAQSELAEATPGQAIDPPKFHIGRVDSSGSLLEKHAGQETALPWKPDESPAEAFRRLVDAVWQQVSDGNPNPRLDQIFDYYLRMVWQLSLAVPLPYVDGHPFDVSGSEFGDVFTLSNAAKGSADRVSKSKKPLRIAFDLKEPQDASGQFDVFIDNLKLSRPIRFTKLPHTNHALKRPIIFLGKCRENFESIPRALSGGPLAFEAYLLWTPKVAPTEHQGSLIRIHGSSGTLFDPTFMRYQVSEQNRLRQTTCEIFVSQGLDSALNIDRESFNAAHPHAVFITKWLHSALRQLASAQKRLASEVRDADRVEATDALTASINEVAFTTWREEMTDPVSRPPEVEFATRAEPGVTSGDTYVFARDAVVQTSAGRRTQGGKAKEAILETKLKAIAKVLLSFGLLEKLSKRKQERLLRAIYSILEADEK